MANVFPSNFNSPAGAKLGATVGGIGSMIFALVWIAFSSVFVAIGGGIAWKTLVQTTWPQVPCLVDEFQILDDPKQDEPFTAKVTFRYEAGGHERTGHSLFLTSPPKAKSQPVAEAESPAEAATPDVRESDYQKLSSLQHRFLSARSTVCRVNPHDPNQAALLLKRDDLWGGLAFGGFGLCFVGIGVGILLQNLRQMRALRSGLAGSSAVTARPRQSKEFPLFIGLPFFGLFAAAGCGMFCFISVPIVKGLLLSPSWVTTPATVIWSRVATRNDSDGNTTHSADVFYRYQFDGKEYKSNRNTLSDISSSALKDKQDAVRANPPGKAIVCYVNPRRPWEAVRLRGFSWAALFGLFPLPFMAVGLGGLWYLLRRKNRPAESGALTHQARRNTSNRFSQAPAGMPGAFTHDFTAAAGELQLSPGKGRVTRFLGTLFIAAFWNGIVSVFLWQLASQWSSGQMPWFLSLFLTPFVLIGLALLGAALQALGAIFNPRPHVTLEPGQLRLGNPLTIAWQIPTGAGRLANLRIALRGEEVATYRRGTNTATDRALFHEAVVVDTTMPDQIAMGRTTVTLPANLMPSWKAPNNRIEWTLHIQGGIRLWPDLADTHVLTILPAP